MSASIFTDILLPFALALIMFGMGLGLTIKDFSRLFTAPEPIFVGLLGQLLLMPLLALGLCYGFGLSPELAIGMMILAACPGGTMSNLISQLARANLALSVSLTSICTIVCVFTTPWLIHFSIQLFAMENPPEFSLLETSIGLIVITLLPVTIGITIKHKYESFADKYEVYFRRFSLIFMILMIIGIIIKEKGILASSFQQVFGASLSLNLISITLGVAIAKLTQLNHRDAITLGIEVGIQNAAMALLIAVTFLNEPAYAITAGVYGLTMYIGPALLVWWSKLVNKADNKAASLSDCPN